MPHREEDPGWPAPVQDDAEWLAARPTDVSVVRTREAPIDVRRPAPRLARRGPTPDLEGVVENVRSDQIIVQVGCLARAVRGAFGLFLLAFKPLLVLAGWLFGGGRQPERQTVQILTVARPDGSMAQARMEGDCLGSLPARGDTVSLWGKWRHRVLVVRRGFNHSVDADIVVRQPRDWASFGCGLLLAAIVFLVLFAVLATVLQDYQR